MNSKERNPHDINIYYEDLINEENYEGIDFIYKSEEKIVIHDIEINKKLAITKDSIGNFEDLIKVNPNLRVLNGYGYKLGDYTEIELSSFISEGSFHYYLINDKIVFYIGSVKVLVKSASLIYGWLKNLSYGYETYTDDYTITISLNGITQKNYSDYFNIAMYILRTIPVDDNEDRIRSFIMKNIDNIKFADTHYSEPFYFYNEAVEMIDREISVLYFYKVLEYFFLVVRKDEFNTILTKYINIKDIDLVIGDITKIYKDDELSMLTILLYAIESELSDIVREAFCQMIIPAQTLPLFIEGLYKFRNSIVHGKSDSKFDLKIPNCLIEDKIGLFWRKSLKNISEVLLNKFCIKKVST